MDVLVIVLVGIVGLAAGGGAAYVLSRKQVGAVEKDKERLLEEASKRIEMARKEAELSMKDQLIKLKLDAEEEMRKKRDELAAVEKRLSQKEDAIDKRVAVIDTKEVEVMQREKSVGGQEKALNEKKVQIDEILKQHKDTLERIANYTAEEAKNELMSSMEEEAKRDCVKRLRQIEEELKDSADKKAQEYIALAIQRIASDFVSEHTVYSVTLPGDEMKGRIIGREGRNIRAFEAAAGVDIIIDDTPEAVIISSHNPVRREVARRALERLIQDGRIHPARIEEIVNKMATEVENDVKEAGEKALFDAGIHNVPAEVTRLLGTLRYRTSYGQNVLAHSIEVSHICGILASEMGLSVKQAKRAGMLHDIGKAVDHEIEGSHAVIGADILKRHNENGRVVNAVVSHHGDEPANSAIAVLVQAADALSAARPGARRESIENYIKRVEELEKIASNFPGVNKAFAVQAGREVRVLVEPGQITDDQAFVLARDISKKVEGELTYPGQIRVTVIRETRAVEYAR